MRTIAALMISGLIYMGCSTNTSGASTAAKKPAHDPQIGADVTVTAQPGTCTVVNETNHVLELSDAAVEEVLGKVEPGKTVGVGGHFSAMSEAGLSAHGYCSVGDTVKVVEEDGGLRALHVSDGRPATEGGGE